MPELRGDLGSEIYSFAFIFCRIGINIIAGTPFAGTPFAGTPFAGTGLY